MNRNEIKRLAIKAAERVDRLRGQGYEIEAEREEHGLQKLQQDYEIDSVELLDFFPEDY